MSKALFGRGAAFRSASCPRWAPLAFFLVVSFCLTTSGFGQSKDDIVAQIQTEVVPEGWDPSDHVLYAFTPNDPYYTTGNPVGFPGQWHLKVQNSGAINDANVSGAWNRDITGQGVTIGIVDDGLQRLHPDLSPNYVAADSW